ncbi:leucine-rich repeat-containing protein 46-like [Narcine bancroftii]|uniref:leucine-rich repeat-containing protein 46-like n=1 Tax=Narcine bancroftii TaxID=1343680 RepID=UPI003831FF38
MAVVKVVDAGPGGGPGDGAVEQECDPAQEYSPESKNLVQISMLLLVEQNLQLCARGQRLEDVKEALAKLTTVRLDRKNVDILGNFEGLENVYNLYLQQNQIKKIENLELLHNLRFLTLAGNKIQKVENLKCLQKLGFLDLSNNQIEQLDPGEFPDHLIILNMSGNDCTKQKEYRWDTLQLCMEQVIQTLPALQQLDGILVQRKKDPNEADDVGDGHDLDGSQSEEDSDEPYDTESEKKDSLCDISVSPGKVKGFFAELHKEMVCRSQERRKEVEKDHKTRLNELHEIRSELARMRCKPMRMNQISGPNFSLKDGDDGQNEERDTQAKIFD